MDAIAHPIINDSRLIQITRDLIGIPTINPPGTDYDECAEFIATQLSIIGMEVEILKPEPKFPIVLGWLNRGARPELHFNGHYDVVPAGHGWHYPPFHGTMLDGCIVGRGSADMKGGIAAVIGAIDAVVRTGCRLRGSVSCSFVPDEEAGGIHGTGRLIATNLVRPDMVIIPEPTFPRVLLGHKGVIQLQVRVPGTAAHAAMPSAGRNAFEEMILIAKAIVDHWGIENGVIQSHKGLYVGESNIRRLPTLTLGGICSTGEAVNSVPSQASFTIDRRFMPVENCTEVLKELKDFIRVTSPESEVTHMLVAEAFEMSSTEAASLLGPLQDAIEAVVGAKAPEDISTGYMDARYFWRRCQIPALAYGPGNTGIAHTADERLSIKQMILVSEVFFRVIQNVLGYK